MKRKTGRPRLDDVRPMKVLLPTDALQRIDELVGGTHRKATFIREAVERELARRTMGEQEERDPIAA